MQNITKVKRIIKEIYLLKNRNHTIRDFAEMFNLSYRTIQRDIKDIESLGIGNIQKKKRAYNFVTKDKPKIRVKHTITKEEKPVKEELFYSEITKNSGILKKDKADMWFYYIKDSNNKIVYVSDKFETKGKAKADLQLAI